MAIIVNNYVQSAIKLANFRIFLTELQQNFNKKTDADKNVRTGPRDVQEIYIEMLLFWKLDFSPFHAIAPAVSAVDFAGEVVAVGGIVLGNIACAVIQFPVCNEAF